MEIPKIKIMLPSKRTKALLLANFVALVVTGSLVTAVFWAVTVWGQWHEVTPQSPVLLQTPLKITTLEVPRQQQFISPVLLAKEIEPKTLEEKEKILNGAGLGFVVEKVGTLESGKGKYPTGHHKFCEQQGKTNEFGFFAGGNRKYCFDSYEDSVEAVTEWFETELQGKTLDQALCYYNTGLVLSTCKYSEDFNNL